MVSVPRYRQACLELLHLFYGRIRAGNPLDRLSIEAGNDVEVDMGDRLSGACAIILDQVEAIAGQALQEVGRELLDDRNGMLQELLREFREDVHMVFGHNQKVTLFKRTDIEEGDHMVIFVDFRRRDGSLNNFAKNTVHSGV